MGQPNIFLLNVVPLYYSIFPISIVFFILIYNFHILIYNPVIRLTMERFRTTFTLFDITHHSRWLTVRTKETIAAVERSTKEDPNESIRHRA